MEAPLPKLDRAALRAQLLAEFERTVEEGPMPWTTRRGRVIRHCEEPARVALDRFRGKVYAAALQGKIAAAEVAFPPPATANGRRLRHQGRQAYSLLTVNGRVRLCRVRWQSAAEGSQPPVDRLLDEAERAISEGIREMAWRDEIMGLFYEHGYAAAWDRLVAWRSTLRGGQRAVADQLLGYVAERKETIRYPEFRRRGWQIGSGPDEPVA
jgi:hypothetical protein